MMSITDLVQLIYISAVSSLGFAIVSFVIYKIYRHLNKNGNADKYDKIYKKYYGKCRYNLNIEKATLQKELATNQTFSILIALLSIILSKVYLSSDLIINVLLFYLALTLIFSIVNWENEFKKSVIDDILIEKEKSEELKEFRNIP